MDMKKTAKYIAKIYFIISLSTVLILFILVLLTPKIIDWIL
jgi:hypothetical protein